MTGSMFPETDEEICIKGNWYTKEDVEFHMSRSDPDPVKGFCEYVDCMKVVEGKSFDDLGPACDCGRTAFISTYEKYERGEYIEPRS